MMLMGCDHNRLFVMFNQSVTVGAVSVSSVFLLLPSRRFPIVCEYFPTYFWLSSEVQQKTNLKVRCPEVVDQLEFMFFYETFGSFEFQNDALFNNNVGGIISHILLFVINPDRDLIATRKTMFGQLNHHCAFVHFFQKAITKGVVYLEETGNDSLGQIMVKRLHGRAIPVVHPGCVCVFVELRNGTPMTPIKPDDHRLILLFFESVTIGAVSVSSVFAF